MVSIIIYTGCASLTGYQDGKSIGEGNGEAMITLNFSQSPSFSDLEDSIGINEIPRIGFPNIEVGGRYGATEKLDVTVRMNSNLNIGVGTKYQIIGDQLSNFAMGLGAEVSTFGLISGLWNVQIPVFTSFHPSEKFSIYASPRYIYQFQSLAGIEGWSYIGGNIGLLLGSRHKFGIDAGFYQVGAAGIQKVGLTSIGIGAKFVFGKNNSNTTISKKRKR